MILMWSYHWWFGYPFVMLPMQEWRHCNPWYALRYYYNYHIRKWSSHTKRGFLAFPLPHMKMNGYCHHQKQFSYPCRCFHCQFNSYRFGATCFDNDNACNDSCRSKQGPILHKTSARKWFHSPCRKDLQLFPSSFWFLFDFLCTWMYSSPSTDLFGTFDVYISL